MSAGHTEKKDSFHEGLWLWDSGSQNGLQQVVLEACKKTFWLPRRQAHYPQLTVWLRQCSARRSLHCSDARRWCLISIAHSVQATHQGLCKLLIVREKAGMLCFNTPFVSYLCKSFRLISKAIYRSFTMIFQHRVAKNSAADIRARCQRYSCRMWQLL